MAIIREQPPQSGEEPSDGVRQGIGHFASEAKLDYSGLFDNRVGPNADVNPMAVDHTAEVPEVSETPGAALLKSAQATAATRELRQKQGLPE